MDPKAKAAKRDLREQAYRPPLCHACGAVLDAPRVNPASGRSERKCCDCERWQPLAQRRPADRPGRFSSPG